MKTVHGAEFYANKKHKGAPHDTHSEDGGAGIDSSPRSEDMHSGKTASMSSPSIKSESDANSPGHPQVNSPMGISQLAHGMMDDYDYNSSGLSNNISVQNPVHYTDSGNVSAAVMDEPGWLFDDENIEVSVYVLSLLILTENT